MVMWSLDHNFNAKVNKSTGQRQRNSVTYECYILPVALTDILGVEHVKVTLCNNVTL